MALHDDDDEVLEGAAGTRLAAVMPEVEGSDFERDDPPSGLWGRIAASIASESTRSAPGAGTVVQYTIDDDDVVTEVDRGWAEFAQANEAAELVVPPSDRTLWSYFEGDEVRDLWQVLVERVRATGIRATVPFRCDAPDTRRWFEMTITPEPDHRVRFRSVLQFEEARPDIPLLARFSERREAAASVPLCSWCDRGHDGSRWLRVDELVHERRLLEEVPVPPVTHGICPRCREQMSAESDRLLSAGTR